MLTYLEPTFVDDGDQYYLACVKYTFWKETGSVCSLACWFGAEQGQNSLSIIAFPLKQQRFDKSGKLDWIKIELCLHAVTYTITSPALMLLIKGWWCHHEKNTTGHDRLVSDHTLHHSVLHMGSEAPYWPLSPTILTLPGGLHAVIWRGDCYLSNPCCYKVSTVHADCIVKCWFGFSQSCSVNSLTSCCTLNKIKADIHYYSF